jgi:DNA adenine methylase
LRIQQISPPIKTFGGKYPLASKLHKLAAPHIHRVHVYGGGLGEMWNWNHEGVSEVVNDIDYRLTNLFMVLQDGVAFAEFERKVQAIPFSEVEWEIHKEICHRIGYLSSINIDAAVSFFILCRQSRSGECRSFAPLSRSRIRRNRNEQVSAWMTAIEGLPAVHNRLMRVVIKSKHALLLIYEEDSPTTLFYLDPPYMHVVRESTEMYGEDGEYEMSEDDHEDLLRLITGQYELDDNIFFGPQGNFMVSGYDTDLYNDYLDGWSKVEIDRANSAAGGTTKRRMVECVWMNYPLVNGCPVVLYEDYLQGT